MERIWLYHEAELKKSAWEIIDQNGSTMCKEDTQKWLQAKSSYIENFLKKWLPISIPFPNEAKLVNANYVLPYQNLADIESILSSITIENFKPKNLPLFRKQSQNPQERPSELVTKLIKDNFGYIESLDAEIRKKMPCLADGSIATI